MCKIPESKNDSPFIVSLYCGKRKPPNLDDYLSPFIDEYIQLVESPLNVNGINYMLNCKGPFIFDAPAKAFIKNIKGHTGRLPCDKCCQEGEWDGHRTVFPKIDFLPRQICHLDN